ncbi:MAG: hypothetical protein WC312_00160 [Candidatus Omnitrophota bacterium]|jgi:hypothetical protein
MNDDIRPLKDIVDIAGKFPLARLLALLLALLIITAVIMYFRIKKRKKEGPSLSPRPADEIARDALNALKGMRLAEKGMIKEYYIRLSDIIRAYIENRFVISAMDRTTWELFQEMRSTGMERRHADTINSFLEDCDMVKFAKYTPAVEETEEAYKKAEEIVDVTTPKPALG